MEPSMYKLVSQERNKCLSFIVKQIQQFMNTHKSEIEESKDLRDHINMNIIRCIDTTFDRFKSRNQLNCAENYPTNELSTTLLFNRAEAQSRIGNICEAISDCEKALKNDKNNVKVLLLRAKCHEYIQQFEKSIEDYELALNTESVKQNVVKSVQITSKIENLKTEIKHQEAEKHATHGDSLFEKKTYDTAGIQYDKAIDCWPENISFYKKRISCYMMIGDYKQALQKCQSALVNDNNLTGIHEYMAECYLEAGINMVKDEKYREASEHLSEALKIIPDSSQVIPKLLYKLAFANSKIGLIRDAINDCTKAIKNNWSAVSFLKLRASCYMSMRNFGKAVEDYKSLLKKEDSSEVQTGLSSAQSKLKRQQSSNYYDILDINKNATQAIIKTAYKTLALIHHPDKHSNAPPNELNEQQEIFKKVTCAYEVLSNVQKRAEYDRKRSIKYKI